MYRVWCLIVVCFVIVEYSNCVKTTDHDDQLIDNNYDNDIELLSYKEQIKLLNKQMTALLSKRREDFELLEDNMRKRFIEKSDMDLLRQELNELRQEIQELRTNKQQQNHVPISSSLSTSPEQNIAIVNSQHPHQHQQHGNQETNDHLTVKWLSDTVNELRTELNEIQYSHNMSVQLEQRTQVQNDMKLLHTDIINMNKELEGVRTEQLKYEATLGQLMEEVTSVRDSERTTAVQCAKVKSQLKAAQLEWSYNWQQIPKKPNQKSNMDDTSTSTTTSTPSNNMLPRKSRHQRIIRNHILKLEKTHADMSRQQTLLKEKILSLEDLIKDMSKNKLHNKRATIDLKEIDNRIHVIETRMNNIEKDSNTVGVQTDLTNNEIIEDNNNILARVNRLEAIEKQQTVSLFNISQQVTSFDRLHRSILELLETVEQLENKVDKTVPDFRKEISQLEFNMAQTLSEIALMKDDQTNLMEQLHTLSTTVNTMHDKFEFDHETLEQLNITVSLLQASNYLQNSKLHDHILKVESSKLPEGIQHLNTSSTNNIVEELEEVENEYHSIINKLPHDCTSVQGPPGLYLISPGPGEPVMVSCNNGWTTVQRRHDGSVDFNRNWDEYSRGFGSASGEFWIGNRVLNRLTHDNCTQLHIKMIDIYGKSYYAEYENFVVENYANGYRLHVSGYHGNSSDALDYQNHMEFSTIDNDRDISNTHCASNYEGGWWFSHCQHANLNGKYNLGLTWFDSSRNEWIAVATSEMKVKRHPICQVSSSISPSDIQ